MRHEEQRERMIFFGHLLFLGVALLLQTWSFLADYARPDFALVLLLVSALFLDFPKIFLMILIAVFFLNWQPSLSLDLIVFSILPILAFLAKKFIPGRPEVVGFFAVFLGTLAFYSISTFEVFWSNLVLAGAVVVWNLVFGYLAYSVIAKFLKPLR
ncbi:MAG: hypothetical protein AAB787_02925 [Patescibacteria group bacterium]